MNIDKWSSAMSRIFFFASLLLVLIAIIDRFVNLFGYTVLGSSYTAGRILQFSGTLLIFVLAVLLREVREELRKRRA